MSQNSIPSDHRHTRDIQESTPASSLAKRLKNAWVEVLISETLFVLAAISIYWTPLTAVGRGSPPEVSLSYLYPTTGPLTMMTLWAQLSIWGGWSVLAAYAIQGVVSFILLLNSSWLLFYSLSKGLSRSDSSAGYRRFVRLEILLPAFLISFSPILVTTFLGFGIEYFALLNISFAFLVLASRKLRQPVSLAALLGSSTFALTLACNEYILAAPIFLVILLALAFCHPGFAKPTRFRFAGLGGLCLIIAAVVGAPDLGQLGTTLGLSAPAQSQPVFHVVNLYYYDSVFRYSPVLPSLFGFNVTAVAFWTPLTAIVFTALFAALLLSILTEARKQVRLFAPLLLAMVLLGALNLNVSNGSSTLGLVAAGLVGDHTIRYDHWGALLSVTDDNRIVLVPFWYVFASLVGIALLRTAPKGRSSRNTQAKTDKVRHSTFVRRLPSSRTFAWGFLVISITAVLVLSSGWASETVNHFGLNPVNAGGTAPLAYTSSSSSPNYNQVLLLPTTSNFTSQYVFPDVMGPEGNDFPFYENFERSLGSPSLAGLFSTLPATTFVYPASNTFPYLSSDRVNTQYASSTNWNESNALAGEPIFVVGPESTFDSFVSANSIPPVNGSESSFVGPNQSRINYLSLPNSSVELWNESYDLVVDFTISVSMRPGAYYPVGLASNSSYPYGYDTSNHFLGIQVHSGTNNSTVASIQYTISNTWVVLDTIPVGGTNAQFNVTILMLNHNGSGNAYVGVDDQWFTLGSGFTPAEFRYVTMNAYNANQSLISYRGSIFNSVGVVGAHWIPVYYDSFFGNSQEFLAALKRTPTVLMAPGYDVSDLALSDLVWSGTGTLVRPAAYSVQEPAIGWFQAFNYNSPQGALYAEGTSGQNIPVQSGYGSYSGYAECTIAGSDLSIPIPQTGAGQVLNLNLLLSPVGGDLLVSGGGIRESISTHSDNTYYKWFQIPISTGASSISVEDVFGFQSVNLVTIQNQHSISSVEQELESILAEKTIVSPNQYLGQGRTSPTSGIFDTSRGVGQIDLDFTGSDSVLLDLPTDVNYGAAVSVESGLAQISIVPAWGSFLGILVTNASSPELTLSIRVASTPVVSDAVLLLSGGIGLGAAVATVGIRGRKGEGSRRQWSRLFPKRPEQGR